MCLVFSVVRSRKFQHRVQRSYTLRVLAAELALKAHCAFNLEQAHAPNCLRALRFKRFGRSSRQSYAPLLALCPKFS